MDILAQIRNRMTSPTGPLPATLPKTLLLGLTAAILLPMMFCGHNPQKESAKLRPIISTSSELSPGQLKAYRDELNRKMEQLQRERESLAEARQNFTTMNSEVWQEPPSRSYYTPAQPSPQPNTQQQEREERKASNVVFSYRLAPQATTPPVPPKPVVAEPPEPPAPKPPTYRVREGSLMEAALTNRLDGTFSGPVDCLVTTPVWSEDRQVLLIPRGARVLGRAERVDSQGQERLAILFHRLFLPDGSSFALGKLPGLNGVGETGLHDRVNHHYGRLVGVSAALGLLGGLALSRTSYGASTSGEERYTQGVVSSTANSSTQILNRQLNILPTVTIREGHRVKVYLTEDLYLPAYGGNLTEELR